MAGLNGEDIKYRAFSGVIWKFAERMSSQLISVVVTIVLARILMPDDYGTIAIVTIFFAFCDTIVDGGLSAALIQKKDADKLDFSTVLTASLAIATLLYIILFIFSPLVSDLFSKPILCPLFRVMGIMLFINGYKSVVYAYVSNHLLFKNFFYSTLSGTIISGIIGIIMAIRGFGPWALAAQQITKTFLDAFVLSLVTRFKPSFSFLWSRFVSLFKYGWKVFASVFLSVAYAEIKPLIVGYKYSTTDLAYYSNGKQYPNLINSSISATLAAVLFPVISKFQDDRRQVLSITSRYMKTSSYVIMPILIGFFVVADNFISVFLTDKWLMSVPYLRVFTFVCLFDVIQVGNIQAIKAIGRSDIYLKLEIIKKTFYFIIIVLFLVFSHSPLMLAASEILCTVIACIVNIFPNRKLINYGYRKQLMDLLPNLFIAILMGFAVYFLGKIPFTPLVRLIMQIIAGIIFYLLMSIVFKNENYNYLKKLVLSRLPK